MADIRQFDSIEPLRLYDTLFLSALVGISEGTIRKVTAGFRSSPLIPRVTRLGPGTVRFAGRDILSFLDSPLTESEQARPEPPQQRPMPAPRVHVAASDRRRPGRPSNRERDAALRAGRVA